MIFAPIISAGKRPLTDLAPGPNMQTAVSGWCRPMTLAVTTVRAGKGGDAEKFSRQIQTDGFMVPGKPQELKIKEEGDGTRQWKFWTIYCLQDPQIKLGDVVAIAGRSFKAMGAWDFSQFGFWKFACTEDFR